MTDGYESFGTILLPWEKGGTSAQGRRNHGAGPRILANTLIGMRGDTFIPLSILDKILSVNQNFPNFLKVKIDINGVNLIPCQAH